MGQSSLGLEFDSCLFIIFFHTYFLNFFYEKRKLIFVQTGKNNFETFQAIRGSIFLQCTVVRKSITNF
jgi:hypothetical protein